jgi:undecaprenyl diphosphate synthase
MPETPYIPAALANVPRARWPRHIAIIMDGNGRWAQARGLPRFEGHRRGAETVRHITEEASRLGLVQLTLYAFSSENWRRPRKEVEFLMELYRLHLAEERPTMLKNNIRFRTIGRRDGIPATTLAEVDRTLRETSSNTGMTLCLAVNYGSRQEIADAARRLAERAASGGLDPASITEETLAAELDTAGMADPDLLIRTANERRLSNFLLWQMSYAEIWVTETLWPEFSEATLHEAILDYSQRVRRFGGLVPESDPS